MSSDDETSFDSQPSDNFAFVAAAVETESSTTMVASTTPGVDGPVGNPVVIATTNNEGTTSTNSDTPASSKFNSPVTGTATLASEPTPAQITATTPAGASTSALAGTAGNSVAASSINGSLAPGAIAGIAIAALVVGAALGAILMLLLRSRRPRNSRSSRHRHGRLWNSNGHHPASGSSVERGEKSQDFKSDAGNTTGFVVSTAAVTRKPLLPQPLNTFMAQQADDATIQRKFLSAFDQVQLHVDNFFTDSAQMPALSADHEGELSRFSTPAVDALGHPLIGLLDKCNRKKTILKHCLTMYALSVAFPDVPSNGFERLLPSALSSMLDGVAANPNQQRTHGHTGEAESPTPQQALVFAQWRQLTAYLRPELFLTTREELRQSGAARTIEERREAGASMTNAMLQRVRHVAQQFDRAFAPFATASENPTDSHRRLDHLQQVLLSILQLSLWLLKEPATFAVTGVDSASSGTNFSNQEAGPGQSLSLMIVPGLVKTYDQAGKAVLPSTQPLQEVVFKRIQINASQTVRQMTD